MHMPTSLHVSLAQAAVYHGTVRAEAAPSLEWLHLL
jgi:hypothetical protein